jgi:putative transposase
MLSLVEQHVIWPSHPAWAAIDAASFAAKNVYNAANYRLRQEYIFKGRYIPYSHLTKVFKQRDLLPDQELPAKVVQQVLRQLDAAWQSFFAALSEWREHPEKFNGCPRLPGYKHKSQGRNLLVYVENAYFKQALRKGQVKLSRLVL